MFWNGKRLSEAMSICGTLYPKLFCYSLSDLHSYNRNGKFVKTNCYSTNNDLISGKGNKAAQFRNFAKNIIEIVKTPRSEKDLFNSLREVHRQLCFYKQDLVKRVKSAALVSGGVRAEFRVRLCDLISIAKALDMFFSAEEIKQNSFTFESLTLVRFISYYIELLYKQILSNFLQMFDDMQQPRPANHTIMKKISTISVLESLLATTLFTGMTYSYASNFIWNNSSVETQSLELMKSIKIFNRPVLNSEFFSNDVFEISCSDNMLNIIFEKITRTASFRFPPVGYMIQFQNPNLTGEQQAQIILKIYFEELNQSTFLQNDNDLPKWKIERLDRSKITRLQSGMTFAGAIEGIFDFKKFEKYPSWQNKYYLKLTHSWMNHPKNPVDWSVLQEYLIEALRTLGVEYVHFPGSELYDQLPYLRVEIDQSDSTVREIVRTEGEAFLPDAEQTEEEEMREYRRQSSDCTWDYIELDALFKGVVKHGASKWKKILEDVTISRNFKSRTTRSMGAKWNNLKNSNIVTFDPETCRWSVNERFREQYPPLTYPRNEFERIYFESIAPVRQALPLSAGDPVMEAEGVHLQEFEDFDFGPDDHGTFDDYDFSAGNNEGQAVITDGKQF